MEEHSQRAKIGGSGRRWQIVPVLGGLGLLIAMFFIAQTPEPPALAPTATVVAEAIVTPSIPNQPDPKQPTPAIPSVDLANQQLLLLDNHGEIMIWDGASPAQTRGSIAQSYSMDTDRLVIDQERETIIIQGYTWLEAHSLRDNRLFWNLPISSKQDQFNITILDVVNDPFRNVVWLVEKQATNDLFQPATVRLRGLDSVSGLELQRYQAPLMGGAPQVLPTENGPWLLAEGQLFPFNPDSKTFDQPILNKLEFAQIAPDGTWALAFGEGKFSEIDLQNQQIIKQTPVNNLPQASQIEQMLASPSLDYVIMIGTTSIPSTDLTQQAEIYDSNVSHQIMIYDRAGNSLGSWQRQLLPYSNHSYNTDVSQRIRFIDDQRLALLEFTGELEIIDFTSGQSQIFEPLEQLSTNGISFGFSGFVLIPKVNWLALVENPTLEISEPLQSDAKPIVSTAASEPALLVTIGEQTSQLLQNGSLTLINQAIQYSIPRSHAPPLLIGLGEQALTLFDPTNQTTITLDLEPAERKTLNDFAGVSAPDNQSVAICYSYHFDASANSRVNRCLDVDLQTGQSRLFTELPAATVLTPIYWDGTQLTIVGTTQREAEQPTEYLLWQTLPTDREQGKILIPSLSVRQLWYTVGSPVVIYNDLLDSVSSYHAIEHTSRWLSNRSIASEFQVDLAPNGQTVILSERQLPLKYGTTRMVDTSSGTELWQGMFTPYQSGRWSGDSERYLIKHSQRINSRIDTLSRQGKLGHSLLVAEGVSEFKSDYIGQRLVLQSFEELYLLEHVNEHWLPLSQFTNVQPFYSSWSFHIDYVYPKQ